MLRITTSKSESRVKSYLITGFSREDYYSEGQEVAGKWGGHGAEMLGLHGRVDREAFCALVENRDPNTGEPLTARTRSVRRVGYDFTWSVPKSVSLTHAITGDDRIVTAFCECFNTVMDQMEQEMQTRVRVNGQDADRPTGNWVRADFLHFTARPENGSLGRLFVDPHLHAHSYVFNCTHDAVESRWKAGQFAQIKRDAPYWEAVFDNLMSQKLIELGYSIQRKAKSYEIAGIPEQVLRQFSKRTNFINRTADEQGVNDPKAKDALGAATRKGKLKDVPMSELRKQWVEQLTPEMHRKIMEIYERSLTPGREHHDRERLGGRETSSPFGAPFDPKPRDGSIERMALDFAILHLFERESVVDERKLLETAIRFGVGAIDVPLLKQMARERPDVLRKDFMGRQYVTTPEVVAEEAAMVAWVQREKGAVRPLAASHVIRDERLNDEQRAAVKHVLESRDRVTGVNGRAGTGKTYAMKEAIGAIERNGHRVFVFAPTAEASRDILRREGFEQAETVEQLLTSEQLQEQARGAVWWIDEAGLMSARSMSRVAKLAEASGARVVLSGDAGQHRAVERGDALRILEKYAGLEVATVGRIQRQEGVYREAVEDLSNGRIVDAFDKLDSLGAIREMDIEDPYQVLAEEYLKARHEKASALVVSPTHSEIRKVTELIREGLKSEGMLGKEHAFDSLRRIDLTQAERSDVRSYREGWVVEIIRSSSTYKSGERLTVEAIEPDGLIVRNAAGETNKLNVKESAKGFQVYLPEQTSIAIGEQIRITKNGRAADGRHRLHNGSLHTVKGFTEQGDLVLGSGNIVPRDYAHMTYGYATTSMAAQGKTVDRVFVAEGSESFVAASREQFYVSVSRGRKVVLIFTDDREELLRAVHTSSQRLSALDIGMDTRHNADEEPVEEKPESLRDRLGDLRPMSVDFADQLPEQPEPKVKAEAMKEILGRMTQPSHELERELELVHEQREPEMEMEF